MTPAALRALLRDLGDTPERVAQTLISCGFKGIPTDAGCCPIARLAEANGAVDVAIDPDGASWLLPGSTDNRQALLFDELPAISAFVRAFDDQDRRDPHHHLYASLIQGGTP